MKILILFAKENVYLHLLAQGKRFFFCIVKYILLNTAREAKNKHTKRSF